MTQKYRGGYTAKVDIKPIVSLGVDYYMASQIRDIAFDFVSESYRRIGKAFLGEYVEVFVRPLTTRFEFEKANVEIDSALIFIGADFPTARDYIPFTELSVEDYIAPIVKGNPEAETRNDQELWLIEHPPAVWPDHLGYDPEEGGLVERH